MEVIGKQPQLTSQEQVTKLDFWWSDMLEKLYISFPSNNLTDNEYHDCG